MEGHSMFLTGKHSKLARIIEQAIREKTKVEIDMANADPIYGNIISYEFTANYLFLTLTTSPCIQIINFQHVKAIRFGEIKDMSILHRNDHE